MIQIFYYITSSCLLDGINIYYFSRFNLKITDAAGAFLMMDMAHISGLVSASVVANPFEFCDIVTTTTHKVNVDSYLVLLYKL